MKTSKIALTMAAGVVSLCLTANAQKRWDAPKIVTGNCSGCHGIDGNAQSSYVPRLAGLNADYAQQKMTEFKGLDAPPVDELFNWRLAGHGGSKPGASATEARINMIGIAHGLTVDETKSSAEWYAAQKPAQGQAGNAALIRKGKALFMNGMAAEGLLACQTCHGPQAEGKAKIPRLAGQNASYLSGELAKFKTGDRKHAPEMTTISQHADTEQFRALAAYLQSL